MLNIGIAAFYAGRAPNSTAIVTGGRRAPATWVGSACRSRSACWSAVALSGGIAFLIGLVTLNLRSDYLAIATIGIAEILRLVFTNEEWLTNGVRGIAGIPKPLAGLWKGTTSWSTCCWCWRSWCWSTRRLERGYNAPWGRVLRAIREDEPATESAGQERAGVPAAGLRVRLHGDGGWPAPSTPISSASSARRRFRPDLATFLIWVMLIAGGSGNNRGAILGAFLIWAVWSGTEWLTGRLPDDYVTQGGALRRAPDRGVLLQVILLTRPQGILPERPPKSAVPSTREGRAGRLENGHRSQVEPMVRPAPSIQLRLVPCRHRLVVGGDLLRRERLRAGEDLPRRRQALSARRGLPGPRGPSGPAPWRTGNTPDRWRSPAPSPAPSRRPRSGRAGPDRSGSPPCRRPGRSR